MGVMTYFSRIRAPIVDVEALEPRRLFAAVYPTTTEQYELELINRARANPAAEATRFGIDLNEGLPAGTISAAAKQPLAMNPYALDAARKHSQWMIDHDVFSHYEGSVDPGRRLTNAGYTFTTWGENIGYRGSTGSIDANAMAAQIHRDLFVDSGIAGRGHRTNMMSNSFREIGAGVRTGDFRGFNAAMVTTDFAANGTGSLLTGVAYSDAISRDNFYTPGEGLAGVVVTAKRASDGATFSTTTWDAGGYSLKLAAGTYTITGTGGGLGNVVVTYANVTIGSQNVKRDFRPGDGVAPPTASIRGTIFSDTNYNGVQETGEQGIAGVLVYIDANRDGRRNSGEKYARSNSAGNYRITGLTAGKWRVRQVTPAGSIIIAPSAGYYEVRLSDGRAIGGRNFANAIAG
jgi:uncharacterized protein YkwD